MQVIAVPLVAGRAELILQSPFLAGEVRERQPNMTLALIGGIVHGDHERLSHFVPKDKLMDAMVNGTPVIALCGKVWVPSRDPEKYPVCPECKEIWESMREGDDE